MTRQDVQPEMDFDRTSLALRGAHGFTFDDTASTTPLTYAHASVITTGGTRFVYLSGATATEPSDSSSPEAPARITAIGDIGGQTTVILERIQETLTSVGGSLDDLVRMRLYVNVELTQEVFEAIHGARRRFFDGPHKPASTLVRVAALLRPDAMLEIDADAVFPIRTVSSLARSG